MLLVRFCRAGVSPALAPLVRSRVVPTKPQISKNQIVRSFVSDERSSFTRTARRRATAAEQVMAPAGETGKSKRFGILPQIFVWLSLSLPF